MSNTIKPDRSYLDPAFSRDRAAGQILAVDLSFERMVCAFYDVERSKFAALESFSIGKLQTPGQFPEKINEILESASLTGLGFRQVRLLWTGLQYTLIPDALYDDHQSGTYLQFTQSLQPGSLVLSDRLKNLHAANAFAMPASIKETFDRIFPGHHTNHHLTILIESLLVANKKAGTGMKVFANIRTMAFDLIILREGHLLFCNTFEYRTAEDLSYYLLFAFEQLKISPATTGITLIGEILKPSAIYDLLYKYIREVTFISRNPAWDYSFVFDELPAHFYYTLLNILTCES